MKLPGLLKPHPTISDRDVNRGLTLLTWEGIVSMGFGNVAGGAILAAFALALGANNLQIGLLAAIPPLAQPLQIAGVVLVDRIKRRKLISVLTWLPAQLFWIPIALIPVFMDVPSATAMSALLVLIGLRSILGAFTGCAWNSWVKDLVPQDRLGRFFARRQAFANMTGMILGLGAAFFVDYWQKHASEGDEAIGYTFALLVGALTFGIASPLIMSLMPEPLMEPPAQAQSSLRSSLTTPLRDRNYRHLLRFLVLWGFAINLAGPFFAVYMLDRIGLSLSTVMLFSMLSLGANILFLKVWGRLADRFGNKTILSMCASLYLLVILGWIFTTMPERYFLTIPLLIVLQILIGIAGAGVGLTTGTISMKLAPKGQATSYLAIAGLATSLGAALGPLAGGLFAEFFSRRSLELTWTWVDPSRTVELPALSMTGFDFLFGVAFGVGLLTLSLITALKEEGEVEREVVLDTLQSPMRELAQPISGVPGVSFLSQFPYGYLRRVPVPGVDVALGVTSYQIADTAKTAAKTAARGQRALHKIVDSLSDAVTGTLEGAGEVFEEGFEVARQTARGALHAADDEEVDTAELAHDTVMGIMRALSTAQPNADEVLRGAGQGIVQGAVEANLDLQSVVSQGIQGVADIAESCGLTPETAMHPFAQGALEAARAAGPDVLIQVRWAIPTRFEASKTETGGEGDAAPS